ncbi:MAG: patatin-like phospholipase family protein, partial [Verrucomicrobiota bacterium]
MSHPPSATPQSVPIDNFGSPMNRLLSIDGGGVKAFVAIEILKKMEAILASRYARFYASPKDFRLCHYFNFIGGTSAGSILASLIATGRSMEDIAQRFEEAAVAMFSPEPLLRQPQWQYRRKPLAEELQALLSEDGNGTSPWVMGDEAVQTLFMAVALNASTGAYWPINNNPEALFNGVNTDDSNLRYPIWQVVRASTAAPTFFPPEPLYAQGREYEFVDGGVCSLNNPAYCMFVQATAPEYYINMSTGVDQMLLVSVGTGRIKTNFPVRAIQEMHIVETSRLAVQSLIDSSTILQDVSCRERGCYANEALPSAVDSELGEMRRETGDFYYLRYEPRLTRDPHSFADPKAEFTSLQLDSLAEADYLQEVGHRYAEIAMADQEFPGGALFPNHNGETGLHVVRENERVPLRHFQGDRSANSVDFLPQEVWPELPPITNTPQPSNREKSPVLSWIVTAVFLLSFGLLTIYEREGANAALNYFQTNQWESPSRQPMQAIPYVVGILLCSITGLGFLGAVLQLRHSLDFRKTKRPRNLFLIGLAGMGLSVVFVALLIFHEVDFLRTSEEWRGIVWSLS